MFDAYTDLRLEMFSGGRQITEIKPATGPIVVRTRGMTERGASEIEVANVAPALSGEAAMLLHAAADSAMSRRLLQPGRVWAQRQEGGFVVATNVVRAAKALRLVDIDAPNADAPAKMAICAMAVTRARLVSAEAPELADAIVRAALDWFPGETGDGVSVANDELCNQGNSLMYLLASDRALDAASKDAFYTSALSRSRALVLRELGGPWPMRAEIAELAATTGSLLDALEASAAPRLVSAELPTAPPGACFLLSPILRVRADSLEQTLAIGDPRAREWFFEPAILARLRERDLRELVAETYLRATRGELARVLASSREVARDIYESGYRFGDTLPARAFAWRGATAIQRAQAPLLSRLLATFAHALAHGISADDLRKRFVEPSVRSFD